MTGWPCPSCGADAVCSRREWVAVYNYRAALREDGDRLARSLAEYGIYPTPAEDGAGLARRWADGEAGGPGLVCASCLTPFAIGEVAP